MSSANQLPPIFDGGVASEARRGGRERSERLLYRQAQRLAAHRTPPTPCGGHPPICDGRGVGEVGFTLLEMLVAVAVLSIAALALVRLDAFTLRSTADLTASTTAQIVAGNKAVDLVTDPAAPSIGAAQETTSNGGQNWRVTSRVAATADPDLLRIDIAVAGNGGRAALTIIRPAG